MSNIVILGGGYGGLTVVNELLEEIPSGAHITLIDRMPFGGLKTEYYALAAGTVSELDIRVAFPSHPQVDVVHGEVLNVDFETKTVHFARREPMSYDVLVIALGCTDNFHGIPGAYEFSTGVQTMAAARRTYHLLGNTKPYGQVTIVGGGLSGVEVASELRESRPDLNIRILDRSSLMSAFPGKLQEFARHWFAEHSVELRSQVQITQLEAGVIYNGSEEIRTDVTVWTAGIQPVELVQRMSLAKDKQGRLVVGELHELPEQPGVFVIGDCSSQPYSPSGQLAQAQGHQVAQVIKARWSNKEPRLPRIQLKGTLGSLGKKNGFGMMGSTPIYGRLARLLKSGVLWKSRRHFG